MSDVITIENRLRGNIELALSEGSLFFQREGSVWNTLRRLATVLGNNNISYAVSGGLASFHHGYRCFTESIDVVVDPAGFRRIENQLSEFERPFATGRRFIDCATGVSVRFYLAGSKAGEVVAFPPTDLISEIDDGIRFVNLPTLLTLKMATGLENSWPTREMADVQEIVKELCLTDSLANELHPAVRAAYTSICRAIDASAGPFLLLWELNAPPVLPLSIDGLIATADANAPQLEAMRCDGVTVNPTRPIYENYAVLLTNSRVIARKYDMHHESEYWFQE